MFTKAASSRYIMSEGDKGPFAHTSYPIGGVYSIGVNSRRKEPDVLAIQLPIADETPGGRAPAHVTQQPEAPAATIVNVPPSNAASSEAEHEPSGHVKNFLQRIPDLSYMLSSTLSIPNKK
jgi:hypothetical protein